MPARRGVQDIRTYAGRDTSPGAVHKKYIRLSTLEMERMRRKLEYDAAQARADLAKARVERLEAEIAEIIAATHPSHTDDTTRRSAHQARECDRIEMKHTYGVRPVVPRPGPIGTGEETPS